MGIKRRGSTKYATRSNSDDKQRRQLAKHPFYGKAFLESEKTKPTTKTKAIRNMWKWKDLGMIEDDDSEE
jgi:hypothetical protein